MISRGSDNLGSLHIGSRKFRALLPLGRAGPGRTPNDYYELPDEALVSLPSQSPGPTVLPWTEPSEEI